jgi:hypothetical protein
MFKGGAKKGFANRDGVINEGAGLLKEDPFFTQTMAELLEVQGHLDDALIIYKALSKSFPDSEAIKARVARLEERARCFLNKNKQKVGGRS